MGNKIKLGICEWSLPIEGPYACKIAAELGLDGVQLDIGKYERGFSLSSPYVQQAYLESAKQYNISFPSIAVRELDNYGMTRPDGSVEKQIAMEGIMKALKAAEAMEIPVVMLPSFLDGEIKTEEDFNRVVNCLIKVCDEALDRNVIVATENLLSIEENKRLFELVNRPNLRLYYDTQNYYLNKKYNQAELADELFSSICEFHVKDGRNDDLSGALLGTGDSGFFDTMKVFMDKGYTGWINIENYYDRKPLSLTNEEPITLIKKDIEILRKTIENKYQDA
ncbi:sugar phosphate isomerase/epimerase family protein [Priestia filamentosa]|uniref:sugar phosphate isomerase/epimerase family protein n=1 Tax=Priestia filamentosa TaxID=1402861 RepID=UPI0039834FDE